MYYLLFAYGDENYEDFVEDRWCGLVNSGPIISVAVVEFPKYVRDTGTRSSWESAEKG